MPLCRTIVHIYDFNFSIYTINGQLDRNLKYIPVKEQYPNPRAISQSSKFFQRIFFSQNSQNLVSISCSVFWLQNRIQNEFRTGSWLSPESEQGSAREPGLKMDPGLERDPGLYLIVSRTGFLLFGSLSSRNSAFGFDEFTPLNTLTYLFQKCYLWQ